MPGDVVTWSDNHHIFHGNRGQVEESCLGKAERSLEGLCYGVLAAVFVLMSVKSGYSSSLWVGAPDVS